MQNWADILIADTLPPPCAQVCVEPCTPSSEDCLYLNIFIPSYGLNSSEPLPVAIWYHGGGFSGGSGGSILYDGRHIVQGRDDHVYHHTVPVCIRYQKSEIRGRGHEAVVGLRWPQSMGIAF